MFDIKRVTIDWAGRPLTLETGRIARQADGSVLATYGETTVHAAVVYARKAKEGQDFFPLTVNYLERYYAAGRVPGGYFKREGRPTEKETLTSRLIDRPIRPLFADGFKNEVQVTITVLSYRPGKRSGYRRHGRRVRRPRHLRRAVQRARSPLPASATRTAQYIINPTAEQMEGFELDLVVAGTTEGVMMVESEAKELSEDVMLGAVKAGHEIVPGRSSTPSSSWPRKPRRSRSSSKARITPRSEIDPGHCSARISPPPTRSRTRASATTLPLNAAREKAKAALVKSEANPNGRRSAGVQGTVQGSRSESRAR